MIADRVVAWTKGAIRKCNFFTPGEIVQEVKKVKSVIPTFLDHCDPSAPFFIGWEGIMNKYFLNLPSAFTFNYFFELLQPLPVKETHSQRRKSPSKLRRRRKMIEREKNQQMHPAFKRLVQELQDVQRRPKHQIAPNVQFWPIPNPPLDQPPSNSVDIQKKCVRSFEKNKLCCCDSFQVNNAFP
jgi:hypothetical protein